MTCTRSPAFLTRSPAFLVVILARFLCLGTAFHTQQHSLNPHIGRNGRSMSRTSHHPTLPSLNSDHLGSRVAVALGARKSKSSGQQEGAVIFVATFCVCVWFFSVPPPSRRTHICPNAFALEKRISGCVAFSDWWQLVTEWYGSCSGTECISWDFSIDPETLRANGFAVDD